MFCAWLPSAAVRRGAVSDAQNIFLWGFWFFHLQFRYLRLFSEPANACVTRRKLQTPGTAEEHQRQDTPTISPNDRQPAQLRDQAPGTL